MRRIVYFVHPLTDTRLIYWPTYWPSVNRYVSRHWSSVGQYFDWWDVSVDIMTDISVEHWSRCRPICWSICWQEWLSDCLPSCRSIGYWHSADTLLLLAYWWLHSCSLRRRHNSTCTCRLFCKPIARQTQACFLLLILFPVNWILCIWQYFTWVSCLITTEFTAHEGWTWSLQKFLRLTKKGCQNAYNLGPVHMEVGDPS